MRDKHIFWAVRNCRAKMLEILAEEMPDMAGQIQIRKDVSILAEMARSYDPAIQDEEIKNPEMKEPKVDQ